MALCAAWPSPPFINATTDGTATLHKRHTVRSTMCGFVALAFAQTHTFQVFFRMTFATVALALLHALLVFPALLAWFGPPEKEE